MSKKSFLPVADASTVIFDADRAKNFQVTLAGNRALKIAGGQEGDEVNVLLIQGGSGSYVPTWSNVTFEAGASPNLSTTVGESDLITLVKRGSSWEDKGGAPSKLPSRVTDAGLTTMIAVAATALTLSLSGGGGEGVGELPSALEVRSESGETLLTQIDGTGSVLVGSGELIIGSIADDASATFKVGNDGATTVRNTISGSSTMTLSPMAAQTNKLTCFKANGTIGYQAVSATGSIWPVNCQ